MRQRTLILGLGNPLRGDDGLGSRVVAELESLGVPEGVTVIDGGIGGLGLLSYLEEWERVLIVDVAELGLRPGQHVRFTPREVRLRETGEGFSVHDAGLSQAIDLGTALGRQLAEIVIFGLQPATMELGQGLSPAVEAAVPDLVLAVLREAKGDDNVQDPGD
jgi:hydrogenase maturation protease